MRGGGRREAVLRRLRARHSGTRSREGRCCAAATRVLQPAPARRLLPPRPYARRARQPPGAQPQLPPPASGPEDVCRPGDVSASGVAWLPRRSPVPLPLVSPGETDAVTAGLGCDMAAGIPPSRHTSPSLRHAFIPPPLANHDVCPLSLRSSCSRCGRRRWRPGGTELWPALKRGS